MAKKKQFTMNALVPLGGDAIQEIGYSCLEYKVSLIGKADGVAAMAKQCMDLNDEDARILGAGIEPRNIRNAATSIVQYTGIIRMLLEGMEIDLRTIRTKQNEYLRDSERLKKQREALDRQLSEVNAKREKRQQQKEDA